MRTNIAILGLAVLLGCPTLAAQETTRSAGSRIGERFKQLDRNGDGKVTREEAAQLQMFKRWDANKDGAVTLEEVTAFYTGRRGGGNIQGTHPPGPVALPRPAAGTFVPDAAFVGEVNGSYIDPEFNEVTNQVVFQDAQNRVWIGDIDPGTGLFKTATARDYLMDEDIAIVFDRPHRAGSSRPTDPNGPGTRRGTASSTQRRTMTGSCSNGWRSW